MQLFSVVTPLQIKLIFTINITVSSHRARMFGPGRGRTVSLMDIPGTSTAPAPECGSNFTEDNRSISSGRINVLCHPPDIEYGLGLLASGSPNGDHGEGDGEVDDKLLDYDSDENTTPQQLVVQCPGAGVEMEIEPPSHPDNNAQQASNLNNVIHDPMYHQCRASRNSSHRDNLVSISPDSTFGKKIASQSNPVGSFEDHSDLGKTFHGSRILKGNATVNQSLSSSFDPSNLICISCNQEHAIVGVKPISVCFTDQNFVASVPSKDGACVNIVRLENPSLLELLDMAKEIFASVRIPEGSVFLFGSISHLNRFGTSLYARDWVAFVAGASASWRGVHVCPLIPLVTSECSGSVTREICEMSTSFGTVYDSDNKGLHEAWTPLVEAMENCSTGSTRLEVMDLYKVALPSSLTANGLDSCTTFCTTNSHPITFLGLSKDSCSELLSILLACVFSNFRACSSPENVLIRTSFPTVRPQSETSVQKVVLIGSSNLKNSTPFFKDPMFVFLDNSLPGWMPTPENIATVQNTVRAHVAQQANAFVFDLLGNSSVRFEKFDGSTSLPFKSQGRFHLGGKVVISPPDIFKKTITAIVPILLEKKDIPCVIVPPTP
jgi:hypothetical protein